MKLWDVAGPELERIEREALRGREYSAAEIDAVLDLAEGYDGPPRFAEGMVEMQRIFMKGRPPGV